jgi:hypothetical protein
MKAQFPVSQVPTSPSGHWHSAVTPRQLGQPQIESDVHGVPNLGRGVGQFGEYGLQSQLAPLHMHSPSGYGQSNDGVVHGWPSVFA